MARLGLIVFFIKKHKNSQKFLLLPNSTKDSLNSTTSNSEKTARERISEAEWKQQYQQVFSRRYQSTQNSVSSVDLWVSAGWEP